jgi:hypothetical protein
MSLGGSRGNLPSSSHDLCRDVKSWTSQALLQFRRHFGSSSQPVFEISRDGDAVEVPFDSEAIRSAFLQPGADGNLQPEVEAYLNEVSRTRPSIVLAFAPKAAGTFLRTAAIVAVDGQLVRTTYAPGGAADSFYLPIFLNYYGGGIPARTMVTHVHMQALSANRVLLEALNLRPVIMIRSIPDMLASYSDELAPDPLAEIKWLNVRLPATYPQLTNEEKGDFLIDMMGPWYISYYATWMKYAAEQKGRVCLLKYDVFVSEPADALELLLDHSGLSRPRLACQVAIDAVWQKRGEYRYNKGVIGRGYTCFTATQINRLKKQLAYYPELDSWTEYLIPKPF